MSFTTYLTVQQTTDRLAGLLPSRDARRVAWNAASDPDKAVFVRQAHQDLDACVWRGRVEFRTQAAMWPRVEAGEWSDAGCGMSDVSSGEMGSGQGGLVYVAPDAAGDADCAVANIPREVKDAVAYQAAARAFRGAGLDATAHLESAAGRGLVSQSAGGVSQTLDPRIARSPWAKLCPEAQAVMEGLRAVGAALT